MSSFLLTVSQFHKVAPSPPWIFFLNLTPSMDYKSKFEQTREELEQLQESYNEYETTSKEIEEELENELKESNRRVDELTVKTRKLSEEIETLKVKRDNVQKRLRTSESNEVDLRSKFELLNKKFLP